MRAVKMPRGSGEYAPAAPEDKDEHIVACAARLFLRRGIEGVKMVEIAKEAEVGVATVYRHFSTKAHIAVLAATLLWRQFNEQLMRLVESDEFLRCNGFDRLHALLEAYCDAYVEHGDFVSFVDEFDHLVLEGQLNKSELDEYGAGIDSFYVVFEDAYRMGRADGSIVRELDFRPFYLSLAHALIGVAEKLRRGEIIPSDDFSMGLEEMHSLINMALWSLAGDAQIPELPFAVSMRG
ncbi:MAG: TetR/AcrR family transcriptional regulator [Atopobiaceae bacterium]|nr:TetR/AcrR family transcriptional regulator [Atopobiaceae bacterium]